MAIEQPISTDPLDNPDHSLSHRVFANDDGAPAQAVVVDSGGNVTVAASFYADNVVPMTGRISVGVNCNYTTLKAAVDYFNASATTDTEIMLDGGVHLVADTIVVNNAVYNLNIRGLDSAVTHLEATTGLTGKPMFNIQSNCNMSRIDFHATSLADYGTLANENCFTYDTTADIYSEITDFLMDGFKIGIADLIGVQLYVFNFTITSCGTGIAVNYTTNSPTDYTMIDVEVGTFESCPIGINLIKTGVAKKADFFVLEVLYIDSISTDIGLKYDGANYRYGNIAEMFGCVCQQVGTLASGFDFTDVRDVDIYFIGNIGVKDSRPHAKISVYGNATTTTGTVAGQFYKANFTNGAVYQQKMTLTDNQMLYLGNRKTDGLMWLSGSLSVNRVNTNLGVCLRREITVTSVIGGVSVATVITTNPHHMTTGQQVQMLGWNSATYNGIKTITRIDDNTFTYLNTANVGAVTGGTCGNLMGIMTVRTATSGQPVNFTTNAFVMNMIKNGYTEIYIMCPNAGAVMTLADVSWTLNTI